MTRSRATPAVGIVGIGCRLAGARSAVDLARCLVAPAHAAAPVPADRWDEAFGPRPYAYLLDDYEADFRMLRMPPASLDRLHRMERAALAAMHSALVDADLMAMPDDWRATTSVHIGATTLGLDPANDHMARVRMRQILATLNETFEEAGSRIDAETRRATVAALEAMAPEISIDSLMTTAAMAAGRFANAFDLGGGHLSYDGGIASSLAALIGAVESLLEGESDRAVVAAVSPLVTPTLLLAHAHRKLLGSGSANRVLDSPIPKGAILGEGAIALVLERVDACAQRGGRVYARVDGIGTAAAGDRGGNEAVEACTTAASLAALDMAGLRPDAIDYVECQAAGLPSTDREEIRGLSAGYARDDRRPLQVASAASHFGFLGAASGLLASAVASLAIASGRREGPSSMRTLHVPDSSRACAIVSGAVEGVRRTAVSAPGFGGVAHHVVLSHPEMSGPKMRRSASNDPIAVTAMGVVVPGANSPAELLRLIERGESALTEMPAARFRLADYAADRSSNGDRDERTGPNLALAGTVSEPHRDPRRFRLPPAALETLDGAVVLSVEACARALAGTSLEGTAPERVGVWIGHLPLRAREIEVERVALAMRCVGIVRHILTEGGADHAERDAFLERLAARLTEGVLRVSEDTLASTSSLECASRVAALYNLRGPIVSVDAACASSLAAVHMAARALRRRQVDIAVVCGVAWNLFPEYYAALATLGALSFEGSRPFATNADGMVPGEGACAIVLRRHADALHDKAPVHALVLGSAIASDGRGAAVFAPNTHGQERALRRAYARAEVSPSSVDLVEGHGAGTRTGDAVEAETYRRVYAGREDRPVQLGSVKSNVGHLSSAAGMVGLIKAALALEHRILLPSRNDGAESLLDEVRNGPIRLSLASQRWDAPPSGEPRRAGVSSFGLGGVNAHLVLEEATLPSAVRERIEPPTAVRYLADSRPVSLAVDRPLDLAAASIVLLTRAEDALGLALAKALRSSGAEVSLVHPEVDEIDAPLEARLRAAGIERCTGVVDARFIDGDSRALVHQVATAVRLLEPRLTEGSVFFASLTRIETLAGEYRGGGTTAALLRSLKHEYPRAVIRAIAIDPSQDSGRLVDLLAREIGAGGDRVEVGYWNERRFVPVSREAPRADAVVGASRGVVLFSGGSRGVVLECARALARRGQAVAITGRTAPPSPEDAWASWTSEDFLAQRREALRSARERGTSPALMLKTFARREARRALGVELLAIAREGLPMTYHLCDATSRTEVLELGETLIARHGALRGIVHGAMIEQSGDLVSKKASIIDATLDVKIAGLAHLLELARARKPEFVVAFGSVAGRFGNRGQADYAVANAAVAQQLESFRDAHPDIRATTIEWTAWTGVGAAADPAMAGLLRDAGVHAISVEEGVRTFLAEIDMGCPVPTVTVVHERNAFEWSFHLVPEPGALRIAVDDGGAPLDPGASPLLDTIQKRDDGGYTAKRAFDLKSDPWLADHELRGAPVLPGAFALEMLAETARAVGVEGDASARVTEVRDFRLDLACRMTSAHPRIVTLSATEADPRRVGALRLEAVIPITNGHTVDRTFCSGIVSMSGCGDADPRPIDPFTTPPDSARRGSAFESLRDPVRLGARFHNIAWVDRSEQRVRGCVRPPRHDALFARSRVPRFVCDPLVLDAAFQIASHWAYLADPRHVPVPVALERWTHHATRPERSFAMVDARVRRDDGVEVEFDVVIHAADGTPFAEVVGLVLRRVACRPIDGRSIPSRSL